MSFTRRVRVVPRNCNILKIVRRWSSLSSIRQANKLIQIWKWKTILYYQNILKKGFVLIFFNINYASSADDWNIFYIWRSPRDTFNKSFFEWIKQNVTGALYHPLIWKQLLSQYGRVWCLKRMNLISNPAFDWFCFKWKQLNRKPGSFSLHKFRKYIVK